jgi:glyoxylase-like metal-dependent hydrolase (beta-lactamase superfamily II)
MKMHLLSGGRLRMRRRIYIADAGPDETIELPVITALIRHRGGNVLFDTGCHPSVEQDAKARWHGLAKVIDYIAPPGADVISGLADLDLAPGDIDLVVNSHLHLDHCGCNEFFRNASFMCHEAEIAAAEAKDAEARGYLAHEWRLPMPIEAVSGQRDLFGDGRLVTIPLPGHTPGLMGLIAGLDREGEWLLASDAVSLMRHLEQDEVPRNTWNAEALRASYAEIRTMTRGGAKVLCGHDDEQWQGLRKGAEAYE